MEYDAYIFDVQGTILDFYGPVARALDAEFTARGVVVPVGDVVRAWRQDYFERVAALDQTVDRWHPVQRVYQDGLSDVSETYDVEIEPARRAGLAASWQQLEPWPDVRDGLRRLRERALTATLSNTDMATMVRLFKELRIDWDAVLTAEVFGAFKPAPALYERTCRYLGVEPGRAAMVASHPYDLRAAKAVGLNTIFVYRPFEFGSVEFAVDDVDGEFDHRITDLRQIP
ncbi:haloacid dehalogenase type II [Gordonia iterans]|uniref:Haloacid dehalogenase type II n=1 Tax=Gordonia iterans TaxID=1004901 RepID=A0A2S0KBR9_9ACTN|nr:haloacid dehalogenase type II [Gordonia iterans]AVL99134.1 haloacid dehalogenase type II [Gordonia iterans]